MWQRLAGAARQDAWPALTGLALGLLALGPALGPGFVLTFDMVFVPQPPIGAADIGAGGGPPRAVPSDLVVALLARIVPAAALQKVILIAIFVLACAGAAALVRQRAADGAAPGLPAELAAGVLYAWNPFVAERLIMGQWALLLGYAGLPWVLREMCMERGRWHPARLAAALLPAAVGGFAAMSVSALVVVPAALCHREPWPARVRRLAVAVAVLVALSLIWLIPAFAVPVIADPRGAQAFAARADTPFGAAGSLLMLGGVWNADAVPAGYGGWASAAWLAVAACGAAGYLLLARRPRRRLAEPSQQAPRGLGIAAVAGACLAALGLTAPTRALLAHAISLWPGFAVLRDGQQFIAPLALAEAVGLAAAVSWLLAAAWRLPARGRPPGARPKPPEQGPASAPADGRPRRTGLGPGGGLAVLAVLAPVLLLPGLAWGAAGRLHAVQYPADWLRARAVIEADRHQGSVLLLPWAQYRSYPWNGGEPVFDPWPKLLGKPMIWNDALQVGPVTVAAESPQARRLGPVVTSGRPLTAALRAAGVRYVIVDAGPLLRTARPRLAVLAGLPGARIVLASGDLVVYLIPAG
jgi:hypothetical protein